MKTIFTGNITNAIGKVTRSLPVALTDQEYMVRAADMVKAHEEAVKAKSDLDDVRSAMNERIKDAEGRREKLAYILHNRAEPRDVECYEVINEGKVEIVRSDTFEVIDYRFHTKHDLQLPLIFEKEQVHVAGALDAPPTEEPPSTPPSNEAPAETRSPDAVTETPPKPKRGRTKKVTPEPPPPPPPVPSSSLDDVNADEETEEDDDDSDEEVAFGQGN